MRDAVTAALLDIASTLEGAELLTTILGLAYEALVQVDHTQYSGLETLILDAGFTPVQVWDRYYH